MSAILKNCVGIAHAKAAKFAFSSHINLANVIRLDKVALAASIFKSLLQRELLVLVSCEDLGLVYTNLLDKS